MKELKIIEMSEEKYFELYGEQYEEGDLWDYPLDEIEYIIHNTNIEKVALINNRLYEIYQKGDSMNKVCYS